MSKELTMAAQQALEACPFCGCDMRIESNRDWHKLRGNHAEGCVFSEDAPVMTVPATDCQLEVLVHDWNTRALTQRPAAQTEREAKMTEIDLQDDDALRFAQRVLEGDAPESDRKAARDMLVAIRTRVRKARASLPSPQQATPEPVGEQATVPRDAYDALERERDYWRTRARAMLDHAEGTCWYWMGDGEDHLESLVNSLPVVIRADQLRELLARPEPGVPEGVAMVPMTEDQVWHNDSIMSANAIGGLKMDAVMRIVRGVEAHHSERLAAAQAKGAGQ